MKKQLTNEDVTLKQKQQQQPPQSQQSLVPNNNNLNSITTTPNTTTSTTAISTTYKPCVIGVIGDSSHGKHLFLNKLADKLIFHEIDIQFQKGSPDESIKIEIYNDKDNQNIYINLNSFHDTTILIEIWKKVENMNTFEIEKWIEEGEFVYMKSLLFLFHVCNIIFLVVENLTIKSEYFLLFRVLKHIKNLISPSITSLLNSTFSNSEPFTFLTPGKSIPILQIFLVKDLSEGYSLDSHLKLEDSLKKQITLLLKNNNLYTTITNYLMTKKTSSSSNQQQQQQQQQEPLFLIESNRPLVRLIRLYQINSSTINSLFQLIKTKNYSTPFTKQFTYYSQLQQTYETNQHNIPMACINSFKQFLGHNKLKNYEMSHWEKALELLTSNQVFDKKDIFTGPFYNTIQNIDQNYSSKLCQNYLTTAVEQYTESLPGSYGQKIHNNRLNRAIKSLCINASGPSLEVSIQLFKEECEKIWKKNRKLCEKESFTGKLCTLNTHFVPPITTAATTPVTTLTPTKSNPRVNDELETRQHTSGYRTRASCNCGQSTKLREDIFDLELGNSLFYQQACCDQYQNIAIASTKVVYQPCKSGDRVEYQTPFSWFNVLVYGPTYTPENEGGFFVSEPVLQPWEIKKIFQQHNSLANNSNQKTQSPKSSINSSSNNNINYPNGKLSFEYQCPTGHRFFEKKRSRKFFVQSPPLKQQQQHSPSSSSSSSTSSSSTSTSQQPIHIFFQKLMLETCPHPECNYMSQLVKVYIQSSVELLVNTSVDIFQSEKQPCDKWSYQMVDYLPVVRDMVYCIRLPVVFEYKGSAIQLTSPASSTFFLNIQINDE
ncbi:hypothetical protein DLAC_08256 [Tieghemostelium lacteum]|uniref:Nonsense-mediated mRNA decay factor SMG8 n=1 Tax=Tieghemostelium lacteum TaxID=361077 RepID=A0A151ZBI5_TIELA|nr:hypothetical protein DLAC_08256 [Tieghemostelium lacteum]|eukprot:KYQ91310.1 hypothetical protein DLAC_08256 [Tieghemostelium lacteum]